jgi:hypothetical protein
MAHSILKANIKAMEGDAASAEDRDGLAEVCSELEAKMFDVKAEMEEAKLAALQQGPKATTEVQAAQPEHLAALPPGGGKGKAKARADPVRCALFFFVCVSTPHVYVHLLSPLHIPSPSS